MDNSEKAELLRLHSDRRLVLETARKRLVAYLEYECLRLSEDDGEFHHRWIEARVKEPSSVVRALEEKGVGPDNIWDEVNDLIGARVVVATKQMAKKLRDHLQRVENGPLTELRVRDMDIPERGYRAIHIKGNYRTREGDVGCEVQIRSELEDFWGVVTRSDFYKGGAIPEDATEMARIISNQLQTVEQLFEALQLRIQESRQSRQAPVARSVAESANLPEVLDLTSPQP